MPPLTIAMIAMHTSPLDQPGSGDAGGMNVYVRELASALARQGHRIDIFTRATSSSQQHILDVEPGVRVIHIEAGPFESLDKNDLPGQMCAMSVGVIRFAVGQGTHYDVIHSHYWLSGHVGWLASQSWGAPLVHSMHTMARVKNTHLAPGDTAEPVMRELGEEQVVREAAGLIANTATEASELIRLYGADTAKVAVVNPGVDAEVFSPGDRAAARARLTTHVPELADLAASQRKLVAFAGRIQALKGPDVLVRSVARVPEERRPDVIISGGASGRATAVTELRALIRALGMCDWIRLAPALPRDLLVDLYRAADAVAVPSRSESFGLVAAEALSVGTPVLAAAVGGLKYVVSDGVDGLLVSDHSSSAWASGLIEITSDEVNSRLRRGAAQGRGRFSWDRAAEQVTEVYQRVLGIGLAGQGN